MEMDLKGIIEKIKGEGVAEAEKQAEEIVSKARGEAKNIVDAAVQEKETIIRDASEEAGKLKTNAEEAIKQAARDVLLGLRENITELFDRVMKKKVAETLSPDILSAMVVKLAGSFGTNSETELEVLLSKEDKEALESSLLKELQDEMKKGVEIKASPNVEHGFRLGQAGSNSYYDFTDEAIEEAFKSYLNKRVTEILTPRG